MKSLFWSVITAFFATLMTPARTDAASVYFEPGGGVSLLMSSSAAFSGAPSMTGLSFAATGGLFFNIVDHPSPVEIHLGVQTHYTNGQGSTNVYTLLAPYAAIRFQFWRFFTTVGYAPFAFTRNVAGTTLGFDQLTAASGSAMLAELGYAYPVTPKFIMGIMGSMQTIYLASGTFSPMPAIDAVIYLRFYIADFKLGLIGGSPSQSKSNYEGWRYPFGIEKYSN